jgi:hypothetical protein
MEEGTVFQFQIQKPYPIDLSQIKFKRSITFCLFDNIKKFGSFVHNCKSNDYEILNEISNTLFDKIKEKINNNWTCANDEKLHKTYLMGSINYCIYKEDDKLTYAYDGTFSGIAVANDEQKMEFLKSIKLVLIEMIC